MVAFQPHPASAQVVEVVGSRALGMGGAFVAVADDSTASWWNPAGNAAGPFFDVTLGWATTDIENDQPPERHDEAAWFALATPPIGFSYYHLRIEETGPFRTIAPEAGGREDRRAAVPDWSLSASQFGATLVHTLVSDLHVGTTLKYVRASESSGLTDANNAFDMDIGGLFVKGPIRVGGVVRNLLAAELGAVNLPRQARVGVAFDASQVSSRAVLVALDADVDAYDTAYGERRVVAVGVEGWTLARRIGMRAGARFNTVGAEEQAYTVGASVAVRSGVYVDGHGVFGGSDDESGWGIGARVTF
jgi:hypothetical protein